MMPAPRLTPSPTVATIVETGLTNRHAGLPQRWNGRVTSGVDAGKEFLFGPQPLVVGAGGDCGLVLRDPKVSRNHVELLATPDGVRVRDLDSTNGTFFGSSRIAEVVLATDASIRVGETTVQFKASAPRKITPSSRRRFGGLVGHSLPMREVFAILEMASPTDTTVLLEGESGTGKELAARALHDHSRRAAGPFVVVDCSAIQEQLIDSHLFGHVRGAFTGAIANRKGAFVEASGGTLFLDELGELPLASQAKLLRVLEACTVQPLGSDKTVSVDTRVVAATHRDLCQMVEEKAFRFDLFFRLAVVDVRLPALRERIEDIQGLVRFFYEGRNVQPGDIGGSNLQKLCQYDWPGNVRELRNVLERGWVLSASKDSRFHDLDLDFQSAPRHMPPGDRVDVSVSFKDAKAKWLELFEHRYLDAVFGAHDYNLSAAAKAAGINRNHFRKLLDKHGIRKP